MPEYWSQSRGIHTIPGPLNKPGLVMLGLHTKRCYYHQHCVSSIHLDCLSREFLLSSSSFGLHFSHLFLTSPLGITTWLGRLPYLDLGIPSRRSFWHLSPSSSQPHHSDGRFSFHTPTQDLTRVFLLFQFILKNRKPNERQHARVDAEIGSNKSGQNKGKRDRGKKLARKLLDVVRTQTLRVEEVKMYGKSKRFL